MSYARGPEIDEHDAETLAHAIRLVEKVEADIAKTSYSGDADSYERVAEAVSIPVIIAGGSPKSDREMLKKPVTRSTPVLGTSRWGDPSFNTMTRRR